MNKDSGAKLRGSNSIVLKKNGTFTFQNIVFQAYPVGDLHLEAQVLGPDERILARKSFTLKVVS